MNNPGQDCEAVIDGEKKYEKNYRRANVLGT